MCSQEKLSTYRNSMVGILGEGGGEVGNDMGSEKFRPTWTIASSAD